MGTLSTFSEVHGARLTKTKLMEVIAPLAEARNESIGTELSLALSRKYSKIEIYYTNIICKDTIIVNVFIISNFQGYLICLLLFVKINLRS